MLHAGILETSGTCLACRLPLATCVCGLRDPAGHRHFLAQA